MTKEEALRKTQDRFTNLLDGKVSSNVSVSTIINYYEDLLVDSKPTPSTVLSGIDQNFVEEEVYHLPCFNKLLSVFCDNEEEHYLTGWDDDQNGL